MEYIGKTSLYQYLKSKPKKRISEQETKKIFRRIIMGIQYLHIKKIAHRDIKLDNIMVNENYDVKIIDFGFSLFTQPGKKLNLHCGTPSYMAPELVAKKDYLGQPVDIWALGVLLYKMLTGYYPFNGKKLANNHMTNPVKGKTDKELFHAIRRGKFRMPEHITNSAQKIIKWMLEHEPEKRPNAQQVIS